MENLRTGERIAGAAGLALLLIMIIFDWFDVEGAEDLGGLNAFESFSFIDILVLLAALAGMALVVVSLTQSQVNMPVALSAITTGLGGLATLLILFRIIVTPDIEVLGFGDVETNVAFGAFLGLIAAAGVAYGGWVAMQEEGTSFSVQADRLSDRDDAPPPPPPSAPPSSSGPAA